MDTPQIDQYFLQLLYSLQAGAMQQMGKIANPMTWEVERDLSMVQHTIEIIAMIEKKTKGNVSGDEDKIIKHILSELRLNYIDELKKSTDNPAPAETKADAATEDDDKNSAN